MNDIESLKLLYPNLSSTKLFDQEKLNQPIKDLKVKERIARI